MSNPFDLLGNDVEDTTSDILVTKELVKNSTSSKKSDVNPKADKSKAKPVKKSTSANETALKTKNQNSKTEVSATASTKSKLNNKAKFDKHSKSGKSDSSKKVKQSWGDDKKEGDFEKDAEADVKAEEQSENASEEQSEDAAEPVEPATPKLSLKEYLAAQQASLDALKPSAPAKVSVDVVENATLLVADHVQDTVASKKQPKSKAFKTKEFLDFNVTFSDSLPQQNKKREFNNNNKDRDSRKPFAGKGKKPQGSQNKKQQANSAEFAKKELNFPSLA